VHGGEIQEISETAGTGSEKVVARNAEVGCNGESMRAEEVHDERADGVAFGDGQERLVEIWVVEAEELKGKRFMVGRGGGRESNVGEIVKGDGGGGRRDGGYVRSGGTSVVRLRGNEYVYGE
jgi:hypothetical protein